jgi:hypothetical protein
MIRRLLLRARYAMAAPLGWLAYWSISRAEERQRRQEEGRGR